MIEIVVFVFVVCVEIFLCVRVELIGPFPFFHSSSSLSPSCHVPVLRPRVSQPITQTTTTMSLSGTDIQKLEELAKKTYKEQAVWFLNAFWAEYGQSESEKLWQYVEKFASLDLQRGAQGFELDELNGHRFLESINETMTVREMRETLRSKQAIGDKVKTFPLVHYLAIKYNIDWHHLVNAPQGNQEEVAEAQRRLEVAQAAVKEAEAKAKAAKAAENEAKQREAAAKAAEAEAKAREAAALAAENEAKAREAAAIAAANEAKAREAAAFAAENEAKTREAAAYASAEEAKVREAESLVAQEELKAALAELKAQEDAFNNKKAELERKGEEGGAVSRNKAKAELAQLLAEDPLPLRRAKINQEAAVRKAEKATQAAAQARAAASAAAVQATAARTEAEQAARQASAARAAAEEAARQASAARAAAEEAARQASAARAAAEEAARQASAARAAAEEAARQAEAAVEAARQAFQEAEDFLERIKNSIGKGQLWWIDREIHEAKAYLPASKGGYAKKKN